MGSLLLTQTGSLVVNTFNPLKSRETGISSSPEETCQRLMPPASQGVQDRQAPLLVLPEARATMCGLTI